MSKRHHDRIVLVLIAAVSLIGCNQSQQAASSKTEPAQVAHHVEESALNTITLTEQAEARLGIALAKAQMVDVRRKRTMGGEVMLPPGQTIVVSAPIAGTLSAPSGGAVPAPGERLQAGQPVFRFTPLLSPEREVLTAAERVSVAQTRADVATAQIEAERAVESAKIAVEAAQIAYDRAQQLLKTKAGSQKSVDEASASLKLAREAQETAEARYRFLSGIELDEQAGQLKDRDIQSPVAGVLQTLDAAAGETVSGGKALFSVIKTDRVWIRVPIYVGQWRAIDTNQPATVAEYGRRGDSPSRTATYVSAPPSANAVATTVDVHYALDNQDGQLYPGQKLAVTVPLQDETESLVVPFKAILYDIHGGEWVYEQLDPRVYARRRVSVEYVDGDQAVLAAGPQPGRMVVTDGAVELFGTEFEVGH
jgi:RND family efflux transporter MFP subunit